MARRSSGVTSSESNHLNIYTKLCIFHVSVVCRLPSVHLWAGCLLFFTPAPHLCIPGSSHSTCFGFLSSCKHLLQMRRKGECSLLFWHSLSLFSFSTTDSSVFFSSSHALPLFEPTVTRGQVLICGRRSRQHAAQTPYLHCQCHQQVLNREIIIKKICEAVRNTVLEWICVDGKDKNVRLQETTN